MNPNKTTTKTTAEKTTADRVRTSSSLYPYVYVTYVRDNVTGFVAVIDPVQDQVKQHILVGVDPGPMCLDIEEKRLYVLSGSGSYVSVIDTNTFKILADVRIGNTNNPYLVAIFASPLGGKVYVANSSEKTVVIIDTLTNNVLQDVNVGPGKPFAFASNKNSNFVYVACKVADGKDYVVAISLEDDIAYPYGKELELTLYENLNPLTVHPDGHTQITLGTPGMLVHTDEQIGKPVTSSLLDNTVSGVYLDNKLLLCTTDAGKNIMKQFMDLAVDEAGNVSYDNFSDVPSYKGQDIIRASRMQSYICITIQPTTTPLAAVQIYTSTGINFPLARFPYVGDLAFSSDTKAYVGQFTSIRPIDLTTARVLPAIPISPTSSDNIEVRNVICGYRNQS